MSDAQKIVAAVTTTVAAIAPATGAAAPFMLLATSAINAIVDLAGPDKAELQRQLAAMRASTDAALRRKHARLTPALRAKLAQLVMHGPLVGEELAALTAALHDLDAYEHDERSARSEDDTSRVTLPGAR